MNRWKESRVQQFPASLKGYLFLSLFIPHQGLFLDARGGWRLKVIPKVVGMSVQRKPYPRSEERKNLSSKIAAHGKWLWTSRGSSRDLFRGLESNKCVEWNWRTQKVGIQWRHERYQWSSRGSSSKGLAQGPWRERKKLESRLNWLMSTLVRRFVIWELLRNGRVQNHWWWFTSSNEVMCDNHWKEVKTIESELDWRSALGFVKFDWKCDWSRSSDWCSWRSWSSKGLFRNQRENSSIWTDQQICGHGKLTSNWFVFLAMFVQLKPSRKLSGSLSFSPLAMKAWWGDRCKRWRVVFTAQCRMHKRGELPSHKLPARWWTSRDLPRYQERSIELADDVPSMLMYKK